MSVSMRRFSVAVVVLAVVGAFLTVYGGPDAGGRHPAAHSSTVKPDKRQFVERRRQRMRIVLVGRAGETAAAIDKAAMTAANAALAIVVENRPPQVKTPQTARETQRQPTPAAHGPAVGPQPQLQPQIASQSQRSQSAPADVNDTPQGEANTQQTSGVAYLPPSMRNKADASGSSDGGAAKPKPKAKNQQAGARVIYRTQQTSGYDRGYYRRGGYGDGYYQPWGW